MYNIYIYIHTQSLEYTCSQRIKKEEEAVCSPWFKDTRAPPPRRWLRLASVNNFLRKEIAKEGRTEGMDIKEKRRRKE